MSEIKNLDQNPENPEKSKSPAKLQEDQSIIKRLGDELKGSPKIEETNPLERTKGKENAESSGDEGKEKQRLEDALKGAKLPDSEKLEGEIKSRFSRENFRAEDSYDARASQETRELASKGSCPLIPMGEDVGGARKAYGTYEKEDISTLKAERERIDAPDENTVMQKVIGIDTGDVEKDLSSYLNPTNRSTHEPKAADVYGFVSKAEDAAPFTHTPQQCYENLKLDYKGTMYTNPNQPVYVLRYTDGTNYEVPYSKEFGGHCKDSLPCTGNGYLASENHLIPEFKVVRTPDGNGAIITDGKIYRVYPDGTEEAVAELNKKHQRFKLCEQEEKNDCRI